MTKTSVHVIAAVMVLGCLATPATARAQDVQDAHRISIQLLFNGQPLENTAMPAFSCFDEIAQAWTLCGVSRGADGYVMEAPRPGRYTLHVEIDENRDNPNRFPGDYDVFQTVQIAATTSVLRVNVLRLLHLTSPWDNSASLDGMLTRPWPEKPSLETPRRSRLRSMLVTFTWDAVAPGVSYRYVVRTASDDPYESGPEVIRGTTPNARVVLRLPVSAIGQYFQFGLTAHRAGGEQVAELFTHDAGAQSWTANFVVKDWTSQPKNAATAAVVPRTAAQLDDDVTFRAEWQQAVPRPAWWDDVQLPARGINSYGDLMSVWQSNASDDRHRFYKLTYQAILDHPGDRDLVATAIDLMSFIADAGDRQALLTFGTDHLFSYNQRTDNCANCKVGDLIANIVGDLAAVEISRGQPEAAIRIIHRLVVERGPDVSDYRMALTFETLSEAYWALNDAAGAKAAIDEGLRRFPVGWQADQLRRTLERYEREGVPR